MDLSSIRPSQATRPIAERERAAGRALPAEDSSSAPQDRVTLSPEARARSAATPGEGKEQDRKVSPDGRRKDGKLTAEQQRRVAYLSQRDAHVRQHEAAHQAAGGSLTGGASYSYEVGPDGRSYAVGGEVPVRLAEGRTPDETIANARQARRAALAPADPSAADLAVAAAAAEMERTAQSRKARLAAEAYGRHGATGAPDPDEEEAEASVEEVGAASYRGTLQAADGEPAGATLVAA